VTLDISTIKNTVVWVLVAVAVIGIVLAIVVKKIIGKVITLVLAAVIVLVGWQQRSKVVDYANGVRSQVGSKVCTAHPKFFGVGVTIPGC